MGQDHLSRIENWQKAGADRDLAKIKRHQISRTRVRPEARSRTRFRLDAQAHRTRVPRELELGHLTLIFL